jgi:putative transposase
MVGLTYSSNELRDVKKDIGEKFRTFVKWNPDDLSQVFVQHPLNKGWLTVPSIRVDYTAGLSWIQHRLIRQHARQQHIEGGTYERLLRARQELHELWMNPIARRNRAQDVRNLAKFTGLSSDQIVLGPDVARPIEVAARVVSKEEVETFEGDVPDFDSFLMARA